MKYRLKSDWTTTLEVSPHPNSHRGRPWFRVRFTDDRLHAFCFNVPATFLEASWEPVPEEPPETPIEEQVERMADILAGTSGPAMLRRAASEIRLLRDKVELADKLLDRTLPADHLWNDPCTCWACAEEEE
jgi:hypothetical protein